MTHAPVEILQYESEESKMSAVGNPIEDYVLGNSAHERERLKLQGKFLEKWTEQFLLSAGLKSGMRVLDVGCGMGDVSLLAARLVGPSGHVTAIDRDLVIVEKARERGRDEERCANIEFINAELLNFHAERTFDAVVGRYVLFFQPDPVAAIAHAAKQVRSQESFSSMRWTLLTECEATQTGHSTRGCSLFLPKRAGGVVSEWIWACT